MVKAKVHTDESGLPLEIPVLLTLNGVIDILLEYLLESWETRSPAWMIKVVAATKIFLEYLSVNFSNESEREIFLNFRRKLLAGTITTAGDPSGLWWPSRSQAEVNRIIRLLTDLFNWWVDKHAGRTNPAAAWVGSAHDLRVAEVAYQYRRNKAFLGHIWSATATTSKGRNSRPSKKGQSTKTEWVSPPAFPEDRIFDLLFDGFKVGQRYNYRDMLITLLMNGAGFRESEPFHLYTWDVMEDPLKKGQALVLIHHPSWGSAPRDPKWIDSSGKQRRGNRVAYLAERYGMSPRDWGLSTSAAGWKGGMHEKKFGGGPYKQAYWFIPELGQLFWQLWNMYMEQVSRIPASQRNHPFALMNVMREPVGSMYKLGKFQESHADAVRRIGLVPAKHLGTSEHGHRYAYGQRLMSAGVAPEMIRRFMHHSDIDSHKVYTSPSTEDCIEHLERALGHLNSNTNNLRSQIVRVTHDEIRRFA